ncbi:MAG: pilus assembly protein [Rhodobacteraceae bacterium]|nr:pilus assembly protein [Paracoccaceae bacterium]
MAHFQRSMRRWCRRKAREEDGTATIPFVIFLPFFLILMISSLDMGLLMIRHVMLERGLDMAVRGLRLGYFDGISHQNFKRIVCNGAGLIPNCMNVMAIELRPIDTTSWVPLSTGATCVDRADTSSDINALTTFKTGGGGEVMLIRACVKFDPMFPMTGLGFHLPKDNTGAYSLVSATAFVNEPKLGS